MPQIPSIETSLGNQERIGGVNIDNPLIRDMKYGAKAEKYQKISNILEKAGNEYQQKWERRQAVERQLTASQEGMNANMAGQQLLQDAQGLPDEQVMPFITKGMEKINSDAYKKYGNDNEVWGQVSLNIQRANAEVQDKAFNLVQTRAKDNALAMAVQNEALLKNTAIMDSNQGAVNMKFAQYDDQLDALTKAGYMSKESAAKSSLDFKGQVMIGRISNMANNDKFGAAAQTLEANRAIIPLMAQVQLENSIVTQAQAKAKYEQTERDKALAAREKALSQEPTNPGGAAKTLGAMTPEQVFTMTQTRAVDDQDDIDRQVTAPMNDANYDELTQMLDAHQQRLAPKAPMIDAYKDQVLNSKTLKPDTRLAIQLRDDGHEEQAKMLQDGIKKESSYPDEFKKIGKTNEDVEKGITAEMRGDPNMPLYSEWLKDSGEGQYASETTTGVMNIAKNYILKHPDASFDDAYKFARTGTIDGFNYARFNGSVVPIPTTLDVNLTQRGLEKWTNDNVDELGRKNILWKLAPDAKTYVAYFKDDPSTQVGVKVPNPDDPQTMVDVSLQLDPIKVQNIGAEEAKKEQMQWLTKNKDAIKNMKSILPSNKDGIDNSKRSYTD